MSEFQLTKELIALSHTTTWDKARLEWSLFDIEKVTEHETCLCGHYPISEICIIGNDQNGNTARVGNCCVKKFISRSDKIFQAVKRVKKDSKKSLNAETIEFVFEKMIINEWEKKFYLDIMRKRTLSNKQKETKEKINHKVLEKIKI